MEPIEDLLKKELIKIWTVDFPAVYRSGCICSEGAMQAEFFGLLKKFCTEKDLKIFVQPTVPTKNFIDNEVPMRAGVTIKPDLVLTNSKRYVIAVFELKYKSPGKFKSGSKKHPEKQSAMEFDFSKLSAFNELSMRKDAQIFLEKDIQTGKINTKIVYSFSEQKNLFLISAAISNANDDFFCEKGNAERWRKGNITNYLQLIGKIGEPPVFYYYPK